MVGAQNAAGSWDGEGAASHCGRLRRSSFISALLLTALLGACAATEPPLATIAPSLPAPAVAAAAAGILAPAVRPAPPRLTGLTAAELVTRYGEPDFRRAELPGELWQYRSAECVLDIFLYHDAGGTRVIHTDLRDRSLVQAEPGRCAGGDVTDGRTRQSRL